MKSLNEYKAEILRRSETKINSRTAMRRRAVTLCVPLCLTLAVCSAAILPGVLSVGNDEAEGYREEVSSIVNDDVGVIDELSREYCDLSDDRCSDEACVDDPAVDFSFSLVWDCYGVASYESASGRLVKTTDATNPDDYVTTLYLTEDEMSLVFKLIDELDINSYPDNYNPHPDGFASDPPMTLILTVTCDGVTKTVSARDIAYSFISEKPEGQRFLMTCKQIIDLLTSSEEWQSLPEYEHFYS